MREIKPTVKYTDGPIDDVKVVKDFLPPGNPLAVKKDQGKPAIGNKPPKGGKPYLINGS